MLTIVRSMLMATTQDLFSVGSATPLFVVISEAQVAANYLRKYFAPPQGVVTLKLQPGW